MAWPRLVMTVSVHRWLWQCCNQAAALHMISLLLHGVHLHVKLWQACSQHCGVPLSSAQPGCVPLGRSSLVYSRAAQLAAIILGHSHTEAPPCLPWQLSVPPWCHQWWPWPGYCPCPFTRLLYAINQQFPELQHTPQPVQCRVYCWQCSNMFVHRTIVARLSQTVEVLCQRTLPGLRDPRISRALCSSVQLGLPEPIDCIRSSVALGLDYCGCRH